MNLTPIINALRHVRPQPGISEAQLHAQIMLQFEKFGLTYTHEVVLARGCRIDFLVSLDGMRIGVEVKRGKPSRAAVARQLERYAETSTLDAVILCMDRAVLPVNDEIAIPYELVSFNAARGIAV